MKKLLLLSTLSLLIFSCEDSEYSRKYLSDGLYQGYFEFLSEEYSYQIEIDAKTYDENPLSGNDLQKELDCLSAGEHYLVGTKLVVELKEYKDNPDIRTCLKCKILPGVYDVLYHHADSIVFERGHGDTHIKYYLKKL